GVTNAKTAFDTAAAAALAATPPLALFIPARTYALSKWEIPDNLTVISGYGAKLVPTAFTGETMPNSSGDDTVGWITMGTNTKLLGRGGLTLDMKRGGGITRPGGNTVNWTCIKARDESDVEINGITFTRYFTGPWRFRKVTRPKVHNITILDGEEGYAFTKCWGMDVSNILTIGATANAANGSGAVTTYRKNFYSRVRGLRWENLMCELKTESGHSYVMSILNLWGEIGGMFEDLHFAPINPNSKQQNSAILMDGCQRSLVSRFSIDGHNIGPAFAIAIEGSWDCELRDGHVDGLRIQGTTTEMGEFHSGAIGAGIYIHSWPIFTMGDDNGFEYWNPGHQNRGRRHAANIRVNNVTVRGHYYGTWGAGQNITFENCDLSGNVFGCRFTPTPAEGESGQFGVRVVPGQQGRNIWVINTKLTHNEQNAVLFSGVDGLHFVNCDLSNNLQVAANAAVATITASAGATIAGSTTNAINTGLNLSAGSRVGRDIYFPVTGYRSQVISHTTGANSVLTIFPAIPVAPGTGVDFYLNYGADGDVFFNNCRFRDTNLDQTVTGEFSVDPTLACNTTGSRLVLSARKQGHYHVGQVVTLQNILVGGGNLSVKLLQVSDIVPDAFIARPLAPGGSEVFAKSPSDGAAVVGGTGLLSYTLGSAHTPEARLLVNGDASTKFAEELDWTYWIAAEVTDGNWEWKRVINYWPQGSGNNRQFWVHTPFSQTFTNRPFRIMKPAAVLPKKQSRVFNISGSPVKIHMGPDNVVSGANLDDIIAHADPFRTTVTTISSGAMKLGSGSRYVLTPASAVTVKNLSEGRIEGRRVVITAGNGNVTLDFTAGDTKLKGYASNQALTSGQMASFEYANGFWLVRIF
ncbi:MAG: hypothetical protein J0L84_16880, partial [Verrucomicrobia bacterium]|nr:hypothetical protein [Verrucomicrobiota bacterium]